MLGDKPLLTPLCPPEKLRGIAWDQSRILAVTGRRGLFLLYSKHSVSITVSDRLRTRAELITLCSENYVKHTHTHTHTKL